MPIMLQVPEKKTSNLFKSVINEPFASDTSVDFQVSLFSSSSEIL